MVTENLLGNVENVGTLSQLPGSYKFFLVSFRMKISELGCCWVAQSRYNCVYFITSKPNINPSIFLWESILNNGGFNNKIVSLAVLAHALNPSIGRQRQVDLQVEFQASQ